MKRFALLPTTLVALAVGALAVPVAAGAHSRHAHHSRHAVRRSHTVRFYATVVKANSHGLLVRTLSGKTLHFSARQIARQRAPLARRHGLHVRLRHGRRMHFAFMAPDMQPPNAPVAINILGLQPGITVLITETVSPAGAVTVTITLPPSNVTVQQNDAGVITDVEDSDFKMTAAAGAELRLFMAADQLSNLNLQPCDTVEVRYHQDAGLLIADDVQVTGASTAGDCTPTSDATGPITQVSTTSIAIAGDGGPMTFAVDSAELTGGFQIGDVVDVTYVHNSDGSLSATDVEYVEQDASGVVTAVSSQSVTITDSSSGSSETFVADSNGLQLCTYAFDGVHVGDQIDVTYHQSAAGLVADSVDDPGAGS